MDRGACFAGETSGDHLCHNNHVRFIFGTWITLITAASLAPLKVKISLGTVGYWHNTIHLVVFFLTGAVLFAYAAKARSRAARALVLFVFCCALEVLEAALYHNSIEWRDVFTDGLAIMGALALPPVLMAFRKRKQRLYPS